MNEPLWTEAFHDSAYQQDQTNRLAIFDSVVEFVTSIGCQIKLLVGHDGTDIDYHYGIYICAVTYDGTEYQHNACYDVRYEFPAELLKKLDAKFGPPRRG